MTAPDETPRATLREDERAVAEVLAHAHWDHHDPFPGNALTWEIVRESPYAAEHYRFAAHVAEQLAPLVASARADEAERIATAIEAGACHWTDAARIARTRP
ncbi:MAG: hypothetical protein JWO46_743 [Nocardioidaceae bacterium]|nr:hypothetical protein [Nocardioidaceae bacterium]